MIYVAAPEPPRTPRIRIVFVVADAGQAEVYRSWLGRLGTAVDGHRVQRDGPSTADGPDILHRLATRPAVVPTVVVAGGPAVPDAVALCHTTALPLDHLVVLGPGPPPDSSGAAALRLPVTVLVPAADGAAGVDDAVRWRHLSAKPTAVRTVACDGRALMSATSPAVPLLAQMFGMNVAGAA